MSSKKIIASLFVLTLALTACGGPDQPKQPPAAKQGHGPKPVTKVTTPSVPASIQLAAQSKSGQALNLSVECGSYTPLKRCARITQGLLQNAASMQKKSSGQRQGRARQQGNSQSQGKRQSQGGNQSPGNSNQQQ